jgi:hypothetical protein
MTDAMTESTAALTAALAKVQAELPKLERDRTVEVQQKNGGSYSYSYVTLANLSDAVLPLLAKHGLAFTAMPGAGADGKMCLRYHLLHESGERLSGEFPISGEGGIQMIGGRISYSRRYCLAAVVGVAADEDDESRLGGEGGPGTTQRASTGKRAAAKRPAPPSEDKPTAAQRQQRRTEPPPLPSEERPDGISQAQIGKLGVLFKQAGMTERENALAYTGKVIGRDVASRNELTKEEASKVIEALVKDVEPTADPELPDPADGNDPWGT